MATAFQRFDLNDDGQGCGARVHVRIRGDEDESEWDGFWGLGSKAKNFGVWRLRVAA